MSAGTPFQRPGPPFRRLLLSIGYGERSQATGNCPTLIRIAAMGMLETPQEVY